MLLKESWDEPSSSKWCSIKTRPVLLCKVSFQRIKAKHDLPPSSTGVANLQAVDNSNRYPALCIGRFVSNPNDSNVCENLQTAHSRPITQHLQLDTGEDNMVPRNSQLKTNTYFGVECSPVVCQRILHHFPPSHFTIIPLPKGWHFGISLEELPGSNTVLERGVISGRTVLMCSTTRLCVNRRNRY